jgi:O-antigen ligase
VFLLGHAKRPDRTKFPSAHNYYLDFIYNFGFISLIPLLAVIGYTLGKIYQHREEILKSPGLLGIAAVVVFMLLADNSLKVGLRQPYSGILTFFLWGVLLSRFTKLEAPKLKKPVSWHPSKHHLQRIQKGVLLVIFRVLVGKGKA